MGYAINEDCFTDYGYDTIRGRLMDGLLTALVSKRLHGLASGYERGGCWGEYTSAVMVYDKCDSCQERCGLVCGLRIVGVRLLSEALVKV